MDDAPLVTRQNRVHDLCEEVPGQPLREKRFAVYEVEQIFAGLGPLQDQDKGVWTLVEIEELDDAGDGRHFAEERDLQGNALTVDLKSVLKRLLIFSYFQLGCKYVIAGANQRSVTNCCCC